MGSGGRTRPVARRVAAVLALAAVAGCSGRAAPAPGATRTDLRASVAQFRTDEGPARVTAGVTNDGTRTIHVTSAAIRWGGLRFPEVRLSGEPVPPGQTAVLRASYDAARCGRPTGPAPVLLATVDGVTTRLPLSQDDPTLFDRLHASTCARTRLDAVVAVRLQTADTLRTVGDAPTLPAALVLTRRPGSTAPVRLVDLGGSVLLGLTSRRGSLPVALDPSEQVLRVPVALDSTRRCDGHSLGQSQQTFVLSAYLRLPGEAVQRVVLALDTRQLALLQEVIDRTCHPR